MKKTPEVLVSAYDKFVPKVREALGSLATFTKSSIRNSGVTFDSDLTLNEVKSLVHLSFFHSRNIPKLS